MVHIATTISPDMVTRPIPFSARHSSTDQPVLLMCDGNMNDGFFPMICDFLDLRVEHGMADDDLTPLLSSAAPLAVIAELDGPVQDGCHILKMVAAYNPNLPVLILTDGNLAELGAVDAIKEIWGLTRVATLTDRRDIGAIVDFLCHAARGAGMSRLLQI